MGVKNFLVLPFLLDVEDELIVGFDFGDDVLVPFSNAPDVLLSDNLPVVAVGDAEPVGHGGSPS